MNITPDALDRAYQAALTSGKVEGKRLARALQLVTGTVKTFTGVYTDKSRVEEYWIPGSAHTGYVITVRNGRSVSACTCKDSRERNITWCKHRLSVALIIRAGEMVPGSVTASPVSHLDDAALPLCERIKVDGEYRQRVKAQMWPEDTD